MLYLIHQTASGTPVGVWSPNHDFYSEEYKHLRSPAENLVRGKLPAVSWEKFADRLSATTPSATMKWATHTDTSRNLTDVLMNVQRTLVRDGFPEDEMD